MLHCCEHGRALMASASGCVIAIVCFALTTPASASITGFGGGEVPDGLPSGSSWDSTFTFNAGEKFNHSTMAFRFDSPGASFTPKGIEFTDSTSGVHPTWESLPLHPDYQGANLVTSGDPEPNLLHLSLFFAGSPDDWSEDEPMILDTVHFDDKNVLVAAARIRWDGSVFSFEHFSDLWVFSPPLEDAYWLPSYEEVLGMVVPSPAALALLGIAGFVGVRRLRD